MAANMTISEEDYKTLCLADSAVEGVASVLNRNGHASWTVCPECGIDDFCHVVSCLIYKEIRKARRGY